MVFRAHIAEALKRHPALRRLADLFVGKDNESGAAAIEFAFLAPAFFFTIYALIEFFRATFTTAVLYFAAEEATRYATVRYAATTTAIQQVAEDNLLLLDPTKITKFQVTSNLDAVDQTKHVTVVIDYSFVPMLPLPWDAITLSGQSRGFIVEK
ncbi:MAG: TadE/TadG family type IV pilus assembly protein [Alphaproteobacteria bacterium]|jgi:Flp pilus assembly protein TadG